jgi:hypothetical protein
MTDENHLDDPARAFDDLRREVSLGLRAIQGLTAERQNMPDYSETLQGMHDALQRMAARLRQIAETPAMQLTPERLGSDIAKASDAARRRDEELLNTAHRANTEIMGQLRAAIQQVQTAGGQRRNLLRAAGGGVLAGMLVWAFVVQPLTLAVMRWLA